MNNIMSSISHKRVVCEVCHGEKYLECCSVDGTDCEKIICPNCNGEGTVEKEGNCLVAIGVIVAIVVAVVILMSIF